MDAAKTETLETGILEDRARQARGIVRKLCGNGNGTRVTNIVYDSDYSPEQRVKNLRKTIEEKTDDPLVQGMVFYGILERLSQTDPEAYKNLG